MVLMVEGFCLFTRSALTKIQTDLPRDSAKLKFAGEKDLMPSINFRTEGEGGKGQRIVAKGNVIPQKFAGTHNKKKRIWEI
jgi:hypothetical protein